MKEVYVRGRCAQGRRSTRATVPSRSSFCCVGTVFSPGIVGLLPDWLLMPCLRGRITLPARRGWSLSGRWSPVPPLGSAATAPSGAGAVPESRLLHRFLSGDSRLFERRCLGMPLRAPSTCEPRCELGFEAHSEASDVSLERE